MPQEMKCTFLTRKEKCNGNYTDCHLDPHVGWRFPHLASQQELGILSQRRTRIGPSGSDHPAAPWEDLKRFYSTGNHYEFV
jgi:hypothetical protein